MFRGAMAGTQAAFQAWAPHPSWGAPMANAHGGAGANFNPYKRVPNPGNAEYWNTKLKENGLGLENMHIRCVYSRLWGRTDRIIWVGL